MFELKAIVSDSSMVSSFSSIYELDYLAHRQEIYKLVEQYNGYIQNDYLLVFNFTEDFINFQSDFYKHLKENLKL